MLAYETMQKIFGKLLDIGVFDIFRNNGTLLGFISQVWPIWQMKSRDIRYKNKAEDIEKHYVLNLDGTWFTLFIQDLQLLAQPKLFSVFLNSLTIRSFYIGEDEYLYIIDLISKVLAQHDLCFEKIENATENSPQYEVASVVNKQVEKGSIPKNTLPFYCIKRTSDDVTSSKIIYPSFLLKEDSWNDFGYNTLFHLFYCPTANEEKYIGKIKILYLTREDKGVVSVATKTSDHIPRYFYGLSENFVSLGQSPSFYIEMRNILGANQTKLTLLEIQDCALSQKNLERATHCSEYKRGLIRDDLANQAVRLGRFALNGMNYSEYYRFNVNFKPPYSTQCVPVEFNFDAKRLIPRRVYCLIGKNGVGKSQFLLSLPALIKEGHSISPFGKILFVSTCYSENFSDPKALDITTSYESCGLLAFKNDQVILRSPTELRKQIIQNIKEIVLETKENRADSDCVNRVSALVDILSFLFEKNILQEIVAQDKFDENKCMEFWT